MKVTPETQAHAQEILDYHMMNPGLHDQDSWFETPDNKGRVTEENVCGTTMCIAGTSVFLKEGIEGLNNAHGRYVEKGQSNLGLAYEEANDLFYDTTNEQSMDAVRAIAAGDPVKFQAILDTDYED